MKGSEPSSPGPRDPGNSWRRGGQVGCGQARGWEGNFVGKTFPRTASRGSRPGRPRTMALPLRAPRPAPAPRPARSPPPLSSSESPRASVGPAKRAAGRRPGAEQPLRQGCPGKAGPARARGSAGSGAQGEKPTKPRGVGMGGRLGRQEVPRRESGLPGVGGGPRAVQGAQQPGEARALPEAPAAARRSCAHAPSPPPQTCSCRPR